MAGLPTEDAHVGIDNTCRRASGFHSACLTLSLAAPLGAGSPGQAWPLALALPTEQPCPWGCCAWGQGIVPSPAGTHRTSFPLTTQEAWSQRFRGRLWVQAQPGQ